MSLTVDSKSQLKMPPAPSLPQSITSNKKRTTTGPEANPLGTGNSGNLSWHLPTRYNEKSAGSNNAHNASIYSGIPGILGVANATPPLVYPKKEFGLAAAYQTDQREQVLGLSNKIPKENVNKYSLIDKNKVVTGSVTVGLGDDVGFIYASNGHGDNSQNVHFDGVNERILTHKISQTTYGITSDNYLGGLTGVLVTDSKIWHRYEHLVTDNPDPESNRTWTTVEYEEGTEKFRKIDIVMGWESDLMNHTIIYSTGHNIGKDELTYAAEIRSIPETLGLPKKAIALIPIGLDIAISNKRNGVGLNCGSASVSYNKNNKTGSKTVQLAWQIGGCAGKI